MVQPAEFVPPPRLRWRLDLTPRFVTMVISGVVTFALLAVMLTVPVPYAVQGAGPTFNTIDGHAGADHEDDDEGSVPPLISIEGGRAYPAEGELRLTTVVTSGGPGFPVRVPNVVTGFWNPGQRVQPVEAIFEPGLTREERDQRSTQQMITSQEHATVAALTELGYDVPAVLHIVGAAPDTGAEGVVEEDDLIVAISTPATGRVEVVTYRDLSGPLEEIAPGSPIELIVERSGEEVPLTIVTGDDGTGRTQIGIYLAAEFEMPLDVTIAIDNVGGPSAGVMFALGIIDVLTPGDLTAGAKIAGTGTISIDGRVGAIGGVDLKMIGSKRDGATHFLTPVANCGEVVGNIPRGLQVIAVQTLAEARAAVEAIAAGEGADLPSCPGA